MRDSFSICIIYNYNTNNIVLFGVVLCRVPPNFFFYSRRANDSKIFDITSLILRDTQTQARDKRYKTFKTCARVSDRLPSIDSRRIDIHIIKIAVRSRYKNIAMENWKFITIMVTVFTFTVEIRPMDSFLTAYLTGPSVDATLDEVQTEGHIRTHIHKYWCLQEYEHIIICQ